MELSWDKTRPLYEQVKEHLEREIDSGTYLPHQKLPPERTLSEALGVSRITIRRALEEATKDGVLYRQRGRGFFVANSAEKFEQSLRQVRRFEDLLNAQSKKGRTKVISAEMAWSNILTSGVLRLLPDTPIMELKLLGLSEDQPVVFYHSYIRETLGSQLKDLALNLETSDRAFSSYDLYKEYTGEKPNRVQQSIEAVPATGEVASRLQIDSGHPLLKVTSVFLMPDREPVELREAYYLGEKYVFHLVRPLDWTSPSPDRE